MNPADAEPRSHSVLGTERHAPVDPGIFVQVELAMFTDEISTREQPGREMAGLHQPRAASLVRSIFKVEAVMLGHH